MQPCTLFFLFPFLLFLFFFPGLLSMLPKAFKTGFVEKILILSHSSRNRPISPVPTEIGRNLPELSSESVFFVFFFFGGGGACACILGWGNPVRSSRNWLEQNEIDNFGWFRWIRGKNRKDRIMNERIREHLGIASIGN